MNYETATSPRPRHRLEVESFSNCELTVIGQHQSPEKYKLPRLSRSFSSFLCFDLEVAYLCEVKGHRVLHIILTLVCCGGLHLFVTGVGRESLKL